jgi:hypothetical protein
LVKFYSFYPTTFKAILVNSALLTEIIRNVKEATCNDVTKHKYFGEEQKKFEEGFDSSVHIIEFNDSFFHFD